jgi:A/G-specific adenine glycosylase
LSYRRDSVFATRVIVNNRVALNGLDLGVYSGVEVFRRLAAAVLSWHQANSRSFPWRNVSDVYKILVAEKLLQQTRAEQAERAYSEIVSRWPDPCSLSRASPRELQRVLRPLGFYRFRARELVYIARALCRGGVSEDGIRLLKGVGDYVHAAVLASCFGKPVLAIDTNVSRVLARVLHGRESLVRREARHYSTAFSPALEELGPRRVLYALLDFGYAVCKRLNPKCGRCPASGFCSYYQLRALAAASSRTR